MDSIIRKYLRKRLMHMRRAMRATKESGMLYYTYCGGVIRRRSPYYFHVFALTQPEALIRSTLLSKRMVWHCIKFVSKKYNIKVTSSKMETLKRCSENPYNMADVFFYDYGSKVTLGWKNHIINLLESENRKMRNGNAIERFLGLKKPIVKQEIRIDT